MTRLMCALNLLRVSSCVQQTLRLITSEPGHEKTDVLHMQKQKMQISVAVTARLINAFVFAI